MSDFISEKLSNREIGSLKVVLIRENEAEDFALRIKHEIENHSAHLSI